MSCSCRARFPATAYVRGHEAKRSYGEARADELLEPAPDRIEPRAAHPGAPWQACRTSASSRRSSARCADALEPLGGFDRATLDRILPAVEQWHYRNKIEYSFGEDRDGRLVLGFTARAAGGRSTTCPRTCSRRTPPRRSDAAWDWCASEGLSAYDRESHGGFLRNLVVREGRRTGQLQARLVTSRGDFRAAHFAEAADAHSVLWSRPPNVAEATRDGETEVLKGNDAIEERICGLRFRISTDAFFQTNTEMAERLYAAAAVRRAVGLGARLRPLLRQRHDRARCSPQSAREVHGLELVPEAISDAERQRPPQQGRPTPHFRDRRRKGRLLMRPLIERAGKPDVVVVDPPRAGLSHKVV